MSQPRERSESRRSNLQMVGKLVVITVAMFGFGFALVPLYEKICEVTGLNQLTRRDNQAEEFARNTQVDTSRTVIVEFDANGRGAWQFKPRINALEVHPGELVTVDYDLVNTQDATTIGQAIPSYAPMVSAQYFHKLECFCFEQQELGGHETRRFPVVFVIDPKLPKDVNTITLSYTFFEVGGRSAAGDGADPAAVPIQAGRGG